MTTSAPLDALTGSIKTAWMPRAPSSEICSAIQHQVSTILVSTVSMMSAISKSLALLQLIALASALPQTATSTCTGGNVQPAGAGPVSSPDTPDAFAANPIYGNTATLATTPPGYTAKFTNLAASVNGYGYMGYMTLSSYDPSQCAKYCTSTYKCESFNICK